ncbi:MAG: hypothetical protein AAF711_00665 [Planctomycetota bacterium]
MPLTPDDPRFQIDDQVFTGFEAHTTNQSLEPVGLTASRVLRFPGSRSGFAVKGLDLLPALIVEGYLQAASRDDLYALIAQHSAWVASTGIVKVTFHETDYPNCTPMGFTRTGAIQDYSDDNGATIKAEVPVRIVFERLQA